MLNNNPVKVIETIDWLNVLNKSIQNLKLLSPIIITTPGNRKRLNLDSKFNPQSIFSDIRSNPNFNDCINAIKFCQKGDFDSLIALGGGSAMDLAKVVIAHLSLKISDVFKILDFKGPFQKKIPAIFLPTTHGTASEVTMWGTIWNMKEKKKYSISHPSLYPDIAILDGNLTLSLPLDISITTIMDALSHSLEAIWNKKSTNASTNFAIKAICEIIKNVEIFKMDPSNLNIRKKLLNASTTAGFAFSKTTTAAAHSISYPLTIHYDIPHGIASSITLLPLLEINKSFIKEPINIICNNLELTFNELKQAIKVIPNGIVPYTLREWNVPKNQLNRLSVESFTKGRMDNNIIDLSKNQVLSILNKVYE